MTYVSALYCQGGIIMSADTQETVEGEKQYSEKLVVPGNMGYPIAIGGAGTDELIDAFSQEALGRIKANMPKTQADLEKTLTDSIREVYSSDMPVAVLKKQYRTLEVLVSAKPPNDDFVIFRIKGRRVYRVEKYEIIGYATAANKALLKRLYSETMTVAQAVLLATYLVSQSKKLDTYVGGDTRVAVVTPHGSAIDDPAYIAQLEDRANKFITLTDSMFFRCADISSNDVEFNRELGIFVELLKEMRNLSTLEVAELIFSQVDGYGWRGDVYNKLPVGSSIETPEIAVDFEGSKPSSKMRAEFPDPKNRYRIVIAKKPPTEPQK